MRALRYLSLFSGIEAASVAWAPLGWEPFGFAEVDPAACAVLKHRFPSVPNFGDVTKFKDWPDGTVDVVCGGSPCQSFSVAGLRAGLADPRGNLALTFLAVVDRYRPTWVVYENVPGLLSSNGGRDFGSFLGGMVELGYGFAYRVLDAQYVRVDGYGRAVPQRRRRVFVVGHLGDWRRAAAVLFERACLRGDPAPRRETGAGVAVGALAGTGSGGGWRIGPDEAAGGQLVPVAGTLCANRKAAGSATSQDAETGMLVAYGGNDTRGPIQVATAVNAHGGPHGRLDFESETFVTAPIPILESGKRTGASSTNLKAGDGLGEPGDPMFTLGADSRHAIAFDTTQITSRENRCNPQPGDPCHPLAAGAHPPAIAFTCKDHGADATAEGATPTLRAMGFDRSHANAGGQLAIAYGIRSDASRDGTAKTPSADAEGRVRLRDPGLGIYDGLAPTLDAGQPHTVASGWAVRRLLPVECERLQGFPDGWTAVPWRGGIMPDGPRYKMLGNSWACNVPRWIGWRIGVCP